MKSSKLRLIQDVVMKYAKVLSNVLELDVEIVDLGLNRIAGTGIFKDRINENILSEGYIYQNVIKTGEHKIIENPGAHPLCERCVNRGHCTEELEISTPIKLNNKVIGVIGLVCSSERQKRVLMSKINLHLEFLEQISDFIGSKVYEHMEIERNKMAITALRRIIDNVDKGIIMTKNDEISHINDSAKKQLNLKLSNIGDKIKFIAKNESIMGKDEYTVEIEDKRYDLLGQIIQLPSMIPDYNCVFIFNEIKKLKADAYALTNSHREIKADMILGKSKKIFALKDKIKRFADSKSTVLITGESGVGKELVSRIIHSEGNRRNKPFVAINCGAIPDELLESELFGYVKGAFTGANPNGRVGKFELANEGVIFLDEIGDMPLHLQVKILRVLQEKKITRIGSNKSIDLDVKVIAATNRDLKKLIEKNNFREDLYYRLNVIPINIPPLRERRMDIEIILDEKIKKYNSLFNKNVIGIDSEAKEILLDYPWPGNVRELENSLEYMINLAEGNRFLTKDMIPQNIIYYKGEEADKNNIDKIKTLKELEQDYIVKTLDVYGWDTKGKQIAAKKLGIGIATLYRKLGDLK
ncbi:sigma 54-interacting transcriptional regulator [Clostridium sp. D2Q-14]|uniref:sigma-54 interaction domain-containing protein n=1 Tax=Anaeromonas gelatinilytica TaxID=2683194 RepID=UPI00193B6FCA|nr:sigma 54-interacting transcriptional regulator [Anaeromonas gelatinilytica]MBS4535234.1 sigma 54-interacting transcriptional regulator [Anaeromonas gelatinilytica]